MLWILTNKECYALTAYLFLHRDYLFLYYTTVKMANFKNLEHKSLQQKENSNFTSAWTTKAVFIKSVCWKMRILFNFEVEM